MGFKFVLCVCVCVCVCARAHVCVCNFVLNNNDDSECIEHFPSIKSFNRSIKSSIY